MRFEPLGCSCVQRSASSIFLTPKVEMKYFGDILCGYLPYGPAGKHPNSLFGSDTSAGI